MAPAHQMGFQSELFTGRQNYPQPYVWARFGEMVALWRHPRLVGLWAKEGPGSEGDEPR
jgi:hypothetical protein